MAAKPVDYGGITRMIQAPCGWTTKGALREANGKLRLHTKVCKTCKNVPLTIPEYNPSSISNGVNRFNRKGYNTETSITVIDKNGSSQHKVDCNVQQIIGLFN